MIVSNRRGACAPAVAACVVAAALAACAAPAAEGRAAPDASVRVLVKLARPSDDAAAIAAEATRVAGVPVTHAAATSAAWHALAVRCGGRAQCDEAIARLRGAATIYQAVEIDGRKTPA